VFHRQLITLNELDLANDKRGIAIALTTCMTLCPYPIRRQTLPLLLWMLQVACGSSHPAQNDAAIDARVDAGVDGRTPASLHKRTLLAPSEQCEFGAEQLDSGIDDGRGGAIAFDAILQASEISSSETTCLLAPDPSLIAATGLTAAPHNTTCKPPIGDSASSGVRFTAAFAGVTFPPDSDCLPGINTVSCQGAFRPVAVRQQPITRKFFIAQQTGKIIVIAGGAASVALDIRNKVVFGYEPGILNLDFDPNNGSFAYVSYITCASQLNGITPAAATPCPDGAAVPAYMAISRFTVASNGIIDATSEHLILEQIKPISEHNGGGATFGPDGNLFIAIGDGGDYPSNAAQDHSSLLGKILRINVNSSPGVHLPDNGPSYQIPMSNPFVGIDGYLPEIYALGFRNPWRVSFDPLTTTEPRLWVGDVGLITAEEINYVEPAKNYGWPLMEGGFCHYVGAQAGRFGVSTDTTCNASETFSLPSYTYRQAKGVAVTGGFVYRGNALPRWRGSYLFADFSLGHIWSLTGNDNKLQFIASTGMLIASFAEDLDHELYVMDWWTGEIKKLIASPSAPARPAVNLSATGCVDSANPTQPALGALGYDVNVPFYSQAAVRKQRYLFLPIAGGGITEYDHTGTLIVAPGSVLMKNFDIAGKHVETRLMFFQPDATWTSWSYKWRTDQSDAILTDASEDISVTGVDWHLPNQGECIHCHTAAAGTVLGLKIEQLNRLSYYPSSNRWANQIDTLRSLHLIDRVEPIDRSRPIDAQNAKIVAIPDASALPRLAGTQQTATPAVQRVAAYLEVNCAHCHQPGGGGRGEFDLHRDQFLRGLCNQFPQSAAYDDPDMRLIKPGDPQHSAVWRRMSETSLPYQMHPYRITVDAQGVALMTEWITTTAAADCAAVH
jgi:glucose/arabinose dehydrogenase/mono/diheme cytochrome c family protein